MSGVELATAYITLIPSMRGTKQAIAAELGSSEVAGAANAAGAKIGAGIGQGTAAGVGQATAAVGGLKGALLGLGSVAVGTAIIAGLKGASDAFVNAGRETLKFQRLTGASAEEASRLRVVAQQTGLSVDQLATGFIRLSKNAETAGGQSALGKIGVSLTDAEGKSKPLTQALGEIADGFKALPNGAEKNAAALQLFGRAGADLLPLLNRGSEGIDAIIQKADELGLTLSQDQLEKVKKYTAAQRDLQASIEGAKIQVGAEVFPVIADAVEKIAGFATGAARAFADLPEPVKQVATALAGISGTAAIVFGGGGLVINGALRAADAWTGLGSKIGITGQQAEAGFSKISGAAATATKALALVGAAVALYEVAQALERATTDATAFAASVARLKTGADPARELARQVDALYGSTERLRDIGNKVLGTFNPNLDTPTLNLGKYQLAIEDVDRAIRKTAESDPGAAIKQIDEVISKATEGGGFRAGDRLKDLKADLGKLKGDLEDINGSGKKAADGTDAFGESAGNAADQAKQLEDNAKALTDAFKGAQDRIGLLTLGFDANAKAASAFGDAIDRSTALDDQASAALGFNDALTKTRETLGALPREVDPVAIAFGGVGAAADQAGEDALKNFITLGQNAKGVIQSFLQAGDEQGARDFADRVRFQIVTALQAQNFSPEEIKRYLNLAGVSEEQVDVAIKFSNTQVELLKLQALLNVFSQNFAQAPVEIQTKFRVQLQNNDVEGALGTLNQYLDGVRPEVILNPNIDNVIAGVAQAKGIADGTTGTLQVLAATQQAQSAISSVVDAANKAKVSIPVTFSFPQGSIGSLFGLGQKSQLPAALGPGGRDGNPLTPFAGGGLIPGTGNSDSVPILATPGEFVLRKSVVAGLGRDAIEALNRGDLQAFMRRRSFATGGYITRQSSTLRPTVATPMPMRAAEAPTSPERPNINLDVTYQQVREAPTARDLVVAMREESIIS